MLIRLSPLMVSPTMKTFLRLASGFRRERERRAWAKLAKTESLKVPFQATPA